MARKRGNKAPIKGDFGWVRGQVRKNQIIGIFDLVGFTTNDSNDDLLAAVKSMEVQIGLVIGREDYAWDERDRGGHAIEAQQNEILTTGNGETHRIQGAHRSIVFGEADDFNRNVLYPVHIMLTPATDCLIVSTTRGMVHGRLQLDIRGSRTARCLRSRRSALSKEYIKIEPITSIDMPLTMPPMA